MRVPSKHYVEQRAKVSAAIYDLVQEIGETPTLEDACEAIARFVESQDATLLTVKISDWTGTRPSIRPYADYDGSINAVSEQLKSFGGCPMTREARIRLAPFSYRSIDREKYSTLLERRFLQETDKLGYRDIAILPVVAGKGIIIATIGLDREFDEKLHLYSAGFMHHISATLLANFPQISRPFEEGLLSGLESSVLKASCEGLTTAEVCKRYDITEHALSLVWKSIETKLEANNRYEAVRRAIAMGELE